MSPTPMAQPSGCSSAEQRGGGSTVLGSCSFAAAGQLIEEGDSLGRGSAVAKQLHMDVAMLGWGYQLHLLTSCRGELTIGQGRVAC